MPNLSVKLDEATRQRLQEAAARQGVTPHALMVKAIDRELERAAAHDAFVARALQARAQVEASGSAIEGPAFADYLRQRARGKAATRPAPQALLPRDDSDA
ncbi:hypothetical protein GPA19_01165 [Azoarcus indigens]|uniref:Ribbon-helix-helix CopG family protein n=1 Tax=Azoarcus indigens TaxID=29545 RepID=A0A4R6EH24_9RHOO|nr:hypothetical protein [Azoarcus indigens]NMG63561.1 hypothetical protein [Azoarcus indigens]TDN57113.1 hypothetical protein C7389_101498 [Azoarcus indigens]